MEVGEQNRAMEEGTTEMHEIMLVEMILLMKCRTVVTHVIKMVFRDFF